MKSNELLMVSCLGHRSGMLILTNTFGDFFDPVQLCLVDVLNTSNSKDESRSGIIVCNYIMSLYVMSTYDNIISVHKTTYTSMWQI